MKVKGKKLLVVLSIIIILTLSVKHAVYAETVSELNGRTVYTVYTREEFLTEVYNNLMNENCKVLIRMTDEALVKEMSYEMSLRQKCDDFYNTKLTFYEEFDVLSQNAMEYLNEDEKLLNTYGVYNKYGILKDRLDAATDLVYTLEQKED